MNYLFTNAPLFVPTMEKTDPRPMTWRKELRKLRESKVMWHMLRNLDSEQFILRLFPSTKVLPDDKVVREHNGSGPKEDASIV